MSSVNPASYTIESEDITLIKPMRTGYTFAGWTGTGLSSALTDLTIPNGSTGNRKYSASWTPITYTISYNIDGGTSPANTTTYTVESETISLLAPSREGYDFMGWLLDGEPVTEIQAGSSGNKTLTATSLSRPQKVRRLHSPSLLQA